MRGTPKAGSLTWRGNESWCLRRRRLGIGLIRKWRGNSGAGTERVMKREKVEREGGR